MTGNAFLARWRRALPALLASPAGNVSLTFGLAAVPLIGLVGAAVDYSRASSVRAAMQAAADATALAMTSAASSLTADQLQQQSVAYFQSVFNQPMAQNLAVSSTYNSAGPSVTIAGTASVSTMFMGLVGFNNLNLSVASTVAGSAPKNLSLNIVFDTSASMIVGATANDVNLISNWVYAHWNQVKPNDPPPSYPGGDNPPCAFACHDAGGSTGPSDIATGLGNAHAAGATTRFDVMTAAAQQLIGHVQSEVQSNPQLGANTYMFNIMSFDTTLHQWGINNMNFSAAQNAISTVTLGLDTHLSSAMSSLINQVGSQGTGASSASPLKFVILITDGLQSDRNNNWGCSNWSWDNAWNFNTCYGGYATTVNLGQCQQLKNNGIVLAVLETPYVPLTGQSPKVQPYEKTVRHVVYPQGPNTASAVSQALASCASTGYYYQATNSSDIATGFTALTDKFINYVPYISR